MTTRLALIENGVVANIVVAEDAAQFAGAVDIGDARVGIGYVYDGTSFTAPESPAAAYNVYSYPEFLEACLDAEVDNFIAIKRGAQGVAIERFLMRAQARNKIDFNVATTQAAFATMVAAGIITQERVNILMGVSA